MNQTKEKLTPLMTIKDAEVNYIWINFIPDGDARKGPLCSVPLHNLAKAIKNAQNNPDTIFNLWVDLSLLDDMSQFWLQSYCYFKGLDNFVLLDLNSIDAYKKNPHLRANKVDHTDKRDRFTRPDYARLLVLRDRLSNGDRDTKNIIYSDLDVDDVLTMQEDELSLFADVGLITGIIETNRVGHGYLCIHKNSSYACAFLTHAIALTEEKLKTSSGSNAIQIGNALIATYQNSPFNEIPTKPLLPIGYKMPKNQKLNTWGIC